MKIRDLTAYEVHLPLRKSIKHASATRTSSENLVVRCRLINNIEGWGEGIPREYVTGESVAGGFQQLGHTPLAGQLSDDCSNWGEVIRLCERFSPAVQGNDDRGCHANALRAAVELSLLDAFGKLLGEPVSRVTEHYQPAETVRQRQSGVRYSAVITAEGRRRELVSALKMRIYGFHQCKVKVGVAGDDDAVRLRRLRRWLGRRIDLRLDANEAWSAREVVDRVEPLLACRVSCIEQPVPHEEVKALAEVRRKLPVPLMLDESLTSLVDAEAAVADQTCDLFNIRLSKCGGFLNSLRLAAYAQQHQVGFQLGCHPGESGILSAAGRHFASSVRGIRYLEGSYDRHVLKDLLTNEDLTFRYGGRANAIESPGLGVSINPQALASMCKRQQTWTVN